MSNEIDGVKIKSIDDLNTKEPEIGIYANIPFETYVEIDALNSSKIRKACASMNIYRRYLLENDGEFKTSYPLEFGTAFALACEAPDTYRQTIQEGPTAKFGSVKWMKEMAENPDVIFLQAGDDVMIETMSEAMLQHNYTSRFMQDAHNELTIIWRCEHTKRLLKARIDIYKDGHVIDVKTIQSRMIDPQKIKWQIKDFKYDIQIALYFDGLRALGVKVEQADNFFVEKNELLPDVVPIGYNSEQLDECRALYVTAIMNIIEAEETGVYNGYAPEPVVEMFGFDEPTKTFN